MPKTQAAAENGTATPTPTNTDKSLGISVPDSQTLSSDAKNSKKFTVSMVQFFDLINMCFFS